MTSNNGSGLYYKYSNLNAKEQPCLKMTNQLMSCLLTGTALTSSNQSMACMKILAVGTGVGSLGGISSDDSSG